MVLSFQYSNINLRINKAGNPAQVNFIRKSNNPTDPEQSVCLFWQKSPPSSTWTYFYYQKCFQVTDKPGTGVTIFRYFRPKIRRF
jgi:hypothetical protein